ncbi:MAG TPA: Rieske (2Fe-2S) protein [Rhizomicrobium sp.]|jgi:nitrite reductase/ring-hydroxylating ferredoxin subunit|nr:Rieske (2Fe-2S) protein [Rhizomicrobium sp.]
MLSPTGVSQAELGQTGRKLLRRDGRQVLLVETGGRVFAIANRCPHEGYPLGEGTLGPDCVLTCNWHNWKFDLASGAALVGRDPVRTYATEIRDGEILVDFSDPPAQAQRARAMQGLEAALADNDLPRMAREAARLERAGFDAKEAIVHAFRHRNDRLENGMTHAHAAAADWLLLAERTNKHEERLAALLEPLGHIAWDTEGAGEFLYATEIRQWDGGAFVAAIEAENEPAAVAHIRGAFADGISYAGLQSAFGEAALAHYADFGHCAIYTLKTGQLIERLGNECTEPALLALTRVIARATREERIPEFRFYTRALAQWDASGREGVRASEFAELSIDGALVRTLASSGRPWRELYDALVGAAAFNLLHFDLAFDAATGNGIADNVGWLDFTHALTFANACRHICETRADLWPKALLQLALFVGRNRKYVNDAEAVERWRVDDRAGFIAREQHALFDHGIVEPIIACHRLKVLFALEDELQARPDAPWADDMCAAVNRYLHTPMKRHHGLRNAAQALDFVSNEF